MGGKKEEGVVRVRKKCICVGGVLDCLPVVRKCSFFVSKGAKAKRKRSKCNKKNNSE